MSFCCNEKYYSRALAAYHSNANEHEIVMNWWQTKMPDIIAKTSVSEPFRVLAVGAGNGKPYDEELLNLLCTSHQKHVVYTVVEPSETAVKGFQDFVKNNKYSSVEFRWFCMTWQDFQDKEWKKQDGSRYNLIHFVHSIYYIFLSLEDFKERIHGCYAEILNSGGAIVVISDNFRGKNSFVFLSEDFWWHFPFNAIHQLATEEGWKVEADELEFQVDLSKCFDEDSVEGNYLLDFLTHEENFRQVASRTRLEKSMKYLENQTVGESKIAYPSLLDCTAIWKYPGQLELDHV